VDHNLVTRTIRVWINQKLVRTQQDNGAGDFYLKDGVYEQNHGPTLQMDTYITNLLMWVSTGTNPPSPVPRGRIGFSGGSLLLSGTNGSPQGAYRLLVATNLQTPASQWTPITTNAFDTNGNFSLTIPPALGTAQQFFLLQTQ